LDLNDSFCTLINKFAWFKRNFQISKSFYLLTNYAKIELFYRIIYEVCLVYIDENKPVCIIRKTNKRRSIPAWRISTPKCTEV